MTDGGRPVPALLLVVGFDESEPAARAVEHSAALIRGRPGRIHVVYVAHPPSAAMLSAEALSEVEGGFDEEEQELRGRVDEALRGVDDRWGFERRDGPIAHELLAAADEVASSHPADLVMLVVGASSQARHRMLGSVPVHLARHARVPVVVVP